MQLKYWLTAPNVDEVSLMDTITAVSRLCTRQ